MVAELDKMEIAPVDCSLKLPDSLIHHIFSFLSPRDVANASVSSKNWNRAWCTYSYVVFHFIYSDYVVEQNETSDSMHIQMQKQDFLSMMQRSICRRLKQEFHIRRFKMYIDFPDIQLLVPYLDQWMAIAVERKVLELDLLVDSSAGRQRSHYNVPEFVMHAKSLNVMSLDGCAFVNGIDFDLPGLQKLSLSKCKLMDSLLVEGLPQLKCFEILQCDDVQNIEIHASTLQEFSFAPARQNEWPRSIDLSSCIALKDLTLCGAKIGKFALQPFISQFPSLERLELQRWYGSRFGFLEQGLRISSQKLKRLIFRDCSGLYAAEIDTPNLESLEFRNYNGPFLSANVPSEIKVHLVFSLRTDSVDFLTKLKDFLLKLSCYEDLKLIIYNKSKDMIVHEKVSKIAFSSLCHFMHRKCICISSKSYTDLMDELFPIGYPKTLYVIHSGDKLFKLISKEMTNLQGNPNLQPKLLGFSVESFEVDDHEVDPATNVFVVAHTKNQFQTSKFILDWKYDASKCRIM